MEDGGTSRNGVAAEVVVYGGAHFFVDAVSAALVAGAYAAGLVAGAGALAAVLGYNVLAFATQPLLGWLVNDAPTGRRWALTGCALIATAFAVAAAPGAFWPAVAMAGIGNAAFHVGGGVVALQAQPGRATLPGLFVAPGAAGLAAGVAMGLAGGAPGTWVLPLLGGLVAFGVLLPPVVRRTRSWAAVPAERAAVPAERAEASVIHAPAAATAFLPLWACLALLAVVATRSAVGAGLVLPWKSVPEAAWALTVIVVAGKAVGGWLADRYGRGLVGVGALTAAAALIGLAPAHTPAGLVALLAVNVTMPITLVALADGIPGKPGFAFGLTCLALVAGALPFLLGLGLQLSGPQSAALLAAATALFWLGLEPPGTARHRGPAWRQGEAMQ